MSKTPRQARPAAAADAGTTRPRPTDAAGHQLDAWGLPLSGPARARALAELGRADPRTDPAAWRAAPAVTTPQED